jgi:ABC-type uncharacterized transport system substrate-binding protein
MKYQNSSFIIFKNTNIYRRNITMKKIIIASILSLMLIVSFSTAATAADYSGKKVLFIDSYHEGYPWSDGIVNGVKSVIEGKGINLKIVRMDTKRNKSEEFKKEAALKMKAVIEDFKPDVVIAADDNASKYLIQPFYKDAKLPFVFCGVNWDASNYGYPYKNVTGMVEVAGAKELIDTLKAYSKGPRIALLSDDTLSSKQSVDNYKNKLGLKLTPIYANTLEEWKQSFKTIQGQYDILLVENVIGINDFNEEEAKAFASENAKIPSGAVQKINMPYAMLGYLKVAEEQGEWSAEAALKILGGTSPSDIPITNNTKGALVVNARLAAKAGVEFSYDLIESAEEVIE